MEASTSTLSSPLFIFRDSKNLLRPKYPIKPYPNFLLRQNTKISTRNRRSPMRITAIDRLVAATDPTTVEISWQIVVGAIAGVIPFVIAGVEFGKRIVAQRKCSVCGGSGLVQRDEYYFRCPNCGGFLPWQSWKRFFSG